MDNKHITPLKELNYANLQENQEKRLRDFEKQFNNEFGTDFYFMVMKREQ